MLLRYDMIYLLTAIGLLPGGSTHLHTNNTRNNTNNNRTTQITTNVEECGPCPVFTSFTLAFALQLRKKHGKTLVRVQYTCYIGCAVGCTKYSAFCFKFTTPLQCLEQYVLYYVLLNLKNLKITF